MKNTLPSGTAQLPRETATNHWPHFWGRRDKNSSNSNHLSFRNLNSRSPLNVPVLKSFNIVQHCLGYAYASYQTLGGKEARFPQSKYSSTLKEVLIIICNKDLHV